MTRPGHYALVQYCPDPSRLEAVNVGVLLLCPSAGFLDVRLAKGHDRLRQVFGARDWELVEAEKRALASRLEHDRESFRSVEDLDAFIGRRAHTIRLAAPRPLKVDDPRAELDDLFQRLVGEVEPVKRSRATSLLTSALRKAGLSKSVKTGIRIRIPAINREVHAAYGYQNGRFNLIEPVGFQSPGAAFQTACTHAVEGKALYEMKGSQEAAAPVRGKLKLVVVGHFSPATQDQIPTIRHILQEHHVGFHPIDELKPLLDDIKRHANV